MAITIKTQKDKRILSEFVEEQDVILELKQDLISLQKDSSLLKDEIKDIRKDSSRNIEILAIFSALLAFVSVEIQLFRVLNNENAIIGLTLILLGSLVFFVALFDLILNNETNQVKSYLIIGLSVVFIGTGVYFFKQSKNFDGVLIKTEEFNKYKIKNDELNSILNCLKNKGYISEKCYQ